jgi:hypothetical protein
MLLKNKRAPCALIHYTSVYKNLRQSHTWSMNILIVHIIYNVLWNCVHPDIISHKPNIISYKILFTGQFITTDFIP